MGLPITSYAGISDSVRHKGLRHWGHACISLPLDIKVFIGVFHILPDNRQGARIEIFCRKKTIAEIYAARNGNGSALYRFCVRHVRRERNGGYCERDTSRFMAILCRAIGPETYGQILYAAGTTNTTTGILSRVRNMFRSTQ